MYKPNLLERNKSEAFYLFIFAFFICNQLIWGFSWLTFVLLLTIFLSSIFYFQWSIFQDGVMKQRITKKFLIVRTDTPKSLEISKRVEKDAINKGITPILLTTQTFDPFSMLYQATAIVYVIDDSYEPKEDALLTFFHNEVSQRQRESALYGFKENIVYTKEGCRRNSFLRVKYSVISIQSDKYSYDSNAVPWNTKDTEIPISYAVDVYMKECNSFQVVERSTNSAKLEDWMKSFWNKFLSTVVLTANDPILKEEKLLGWDHFINWFFACPCCSQIEIEKTRIRPSKFRTSYIGMVLLAIYEKTFTKIFLKNQYKAIKLWTIPRYLNQFYNEVVLSITPLFSKRPEIPSEISSSSSTPTVENVPKEEVVDVPYKNVFGDMELLDILDKIGKDDYIENILVKKTTTDLVINKSFFYSEKPFVSYPHHFVFEFVLINWREEDSILTVENPITKVNTFFQVKDEKWRNFLNSLKPGQSVDNEFLSQFTEEEQKFFVASRLVVPKNYEELEKEKFDLKTKTTYDDVIQKGYTLIENLLDPILLSSLSKYNSGIFEHFGGMDKPGKWKTYNDENVGRYYQYTLTDFVSKLLKKNISNSSLTLNIYIREGDGFEPHVDSSPPFDITLDIVTDHRGKGERPIYIVKGTHDQWVPPIEKFSLHLGQSALFVGSQLLHYGGYLEKGSYHNVTLFTYQYVD